MFLQEFLVVFLGNFTVVIIEFGLMILLCGRYILFGATRGRVRDSGRGRTKGLTNLLGIDLLRIPPGVLQDSGCN